MRIVRTAWGSLPRPACRVRLTLDSLLCLNSRVQLSRDSLPRPARRVRLTLDSLPRLNSRVQLRRGSLPRPVRRVRPSLDSPQAPPEVRSFIRLGSIASAPIDQATSRAPCNSATRHAGIAGARSFTLRRCTRGASMARTCRRWASSRCRGSHPRLRIGRVVRAAGASEQRKGGVFAGNLTHKRMPPGNRQVSELQGLKRLAPQPITAQG